MYEQNEPVPAFVSAEAGALAEMVKASMEQVAVAEEGLTKAQAVFKDAAKRLQAAQAASSAYEQAWDKYDRPNTAAPSTITATTGGRWVSS
jgi:hypothetical protein